MQSGKLRQLMGFGGCVWRSPEECHVVPTMPAIALSAYTRAEDRGSAEDAGFTRW